MSLDPITAVLNVGNTLVDKFFKDADAADERKFELLKAAQAGDLELLIKQVELLSKQQEINLADAKSGNWFQANWRPSIGWVGSVSLALMYIPKAIVMTYIWSYQSFTLLSSWDGVTPITVPHFPDLGVSDIIGLLMSMLGVAAMRSYDKKQGTDTKR